METEVKLTKLASCAGCGAKVGAGTLVSLLDGCNRDFASHGIRIVGDVSRAMQDILYDPQTSGGLLMALPENAAGECLAELNAASIPAARIGRVSKRTDAAILLH